MINVKLDSKARSVISKTANIGEGESQSQNYEIEFSFTQQDSIETTIIGLIPREEVVETFIISFLNSQLESLELPDRVNNIAEVVALAETYKTSIGAVIVCLLCTFMLAKIIYDDENHMMCYALLYGEEDTVEKRWDILVDKFGTAGKNRIAEFSETSVYDITASYLHYVRLLN